MVTTCYITVADIYFARSNEEEIGPYKGPFLLTSRTLRTHRTHRTHRTRTHRTHRTRTHRTSRNASRVSFPNVCFDLQTKVTGKSYMRKLRKLHAKVTKVAKVTCESYIGKLYNYTKRNRPRRVC